MTHWRASLQVRDSFQHMLTVELLGDAFIRLFDFLIDELLECHVVRSESIGSEVVESENKDISLVRTSNTHPITFIS